MTTWMIAAVCGVALAALSYLRRGAGFGPGLLPALLRAFSLTLLVALLLDATAGARRPVRPIVALDASSSWLRGRDSVVWRDARRRATELARGDSLFLLGDSARLAPAPGTPTDLASRARPIVERALAAGRPLVLITDGEIDDPAALEDLPSGSRIEVAAGDPRRDAAVIDVRAPRAAVVGDTMEVAVTIGAGAGGAGAGAIELTLDGAPVARAAVDSLPPFGERSVALSARAPVRAGAALLGATLTTPGDAEPHNDRLTTVIEASPAAGALLVSTSPDLDAREALAVLRGALAMPARGYYRVAPGAWRLEGTLRPVSEDEVRRALREAPLVVLHGDTAAFGAPRTITRGALALVAPPSERGGDWFAVAAPPSPIAAALSGVPWDSLPPIDVAPALPTLQWEGLETRQARRFERRVAIAGTDTPRRMVVVGASGFWRWRFRGGVGADAFAALWGSIFDWLSAGRSDVRLAVPAEGIVRAGDRIRWRRGAAPDSVVTVVVSRRGAPARVDSMMLRFGEGASIVESDALPEGVYDVGVRGGGSVLVVNPSRELIPRRPTVREGEIGRGASLADAPRLRSLGWVFLLLVLSLCGEWLLRRRAGLR